MKRKDFLILAALIGLWLAWPTIDRQIIRPLFFGAPAPIEQEEPEPPPAPPAPEIEDPTPRPEPALAPAPEPVAEEEIERPPEVRVTLENEVLAVEISSHGGGVAHAVLKEYPASMEEDSPPVAFDFSALPALVYEDTPGLDRQSAFIVQRADRQSVLLELGLAGGLTLERSIRLGDSYELMVRDRFISAAGMEPVRMSGVLRLARMPAMDDGTAMRGVAYLGVDTLSPGGEKVRHLGRRIPRLFRDAARNRRLPEEIRRRPHESPVEWIAAKNKYFVQILAPSGGGEWVEVEARRAVLPEESNPEYIARMQPLEWVSARLGLPEVACLPGTAVERTFSYYIGPKRYDALAALGMRRADVMEFGMWAPVGKLLLQVLNFLQRTIWPYNYGLAIILLTLLIRVVFWPVTRKSTQSMKKMQAIQPLLKEINTKYADNPQKKQQALMALYKEHKVNPLGGCLPMLIQFPVLIALFVVLRSAIELRFARFLWIRDLSEQEALFSFGFSIPLVGWDVFNILPLLMSATMIWQQKLTPSGGDPQQQKMMAFMPVMMLFFFYTMPSGLVLYWTTSQCLMIAQQLMMRREKRRVPQTPPSPAPPKRPSPARRARRKR